jgi:hypothetical protein
MRNIAALLAETSTLLLPDAALRFADAGIPVFPCVAGEKRPRTAHGFHDASINPHIIRAWWEATPTANIGIPTGQPSGIDVVDVDRHGNKNGFARFDDARQAGLTDGWAALVRTPSGGIHAYYPADPDRRQQSWQAPRASIDFRGDGGYVLAPPSVVGPPTRQTGYALFNAAISASAAIDAAHLRTFLDPAPARSASESALHRGSVDVGSLARWVAARGEGERNAGLFWAACRAAETGLTEHELLTALGPAAEKAGLPLREISTTLRSAVRATTHQPARAGFLPEQPAQIRGQRGTGPPRL